MTTTTTMTTTSTTGKYEAALIVAKDAETLSTELNAVIVNASIQAIQDRGMFSVALSGGSNVGFLAALPKAFASTHINPQFHLWHVILADERCVPTAHDDSNMGALQKGLFSKLTTTCTSCSAIPQSQIHGINQELLQESSLSSLSSTAAAQVAADYEQIVRSVIKKSGGKLDMAILGFGPDGHTCSLFPNHALLKEEIKWVASLEDSPKPPPSRITLTFPVLNFKTRHVVFCGAGTSKAPILRNVFENVRVTTTTTSSSSLTTTTTTTTCMATMKDPALYPCGAVRPEDGALTWVVDVDAMEGILLLDSS